LHLIYLGGEQFVDRLQGLIDGEKDLTEIPIAQRRSKPLSMNEYEENINCRNEAIVAAYLSGGYSQKEIGKHFGLHYSRVNRIVKMAKGKT